MVSTIAIQTLSDRWVGDDDVCGGGGSGETAEPYHDMILASISVPMSHNSALSPFKEGPRVVSQPAWRLDRDWTDNFCAVFRHCGHIFRKYWRRGGDI